MTRQQKTPRQRAEEALAAAERAVARLDKKTDTLAGQLADASHELADAVVRRDYLANNPDLQQHPTTSTGDTA